MLVGRSEKKKRDMADTVKPDQDDNQPILG